MIPWENYGAPHRRAYPTSARQREVLKAIQKYRAAKGFAISIRELADVLGIRSTNGANDHLRALERKGLITHEKQRARTIQLTDAGQREITHG